MAADHALLLVKTGEHEARLVCLSCPYEREFVVDARGNVTGRGTSINRGDLAVAHVYGPPDGPGLSATVE